MLPKITLNKTKELNISKIIIKMAPIVRDSPAKVVATPKRTHIKTYASPNKNKGTTCLTMVAG
jgi:hypothetical protein